jgi:hypothetical protein
MRSIIILLNFYSQAERTVVHCGSFPVVVVVAVVVASLASMNACARGAR